MKFVKKNKTKNNLYASVPTRVRRFNMPAGVSPNIKVTPCFLHLIDHSENIRYFIVVLGTFQYVQSKYYIKQVLLPASVFDKQNGRLHRANTFVHSLYILSQKSHTKLPYL